MLIKKLFPYAIGACLALSMMSIATVAQTVETRQRLVSRNFEPSAQSFLEDEPTVIAFASPDEARADLPERANYVAANVAVNFKYEQMIYAAIDQRLGARYVWGAVGPSAYDCSGFVWSTFKSAGVDFERSSARALWARFAPATPNEQFKFGTLVFFRGLKHIGIVADEHGFYHASRSNGVVYSPFNDYWLSRVDGFRRVPLPTLATSAQTEHTLD
ncbi:MAG: C40 family peptidase [Pyrinomonadaceae bacterium]